MPGRHIGTRLVRVLAAVILLGVIGGCLQSNRQVHAAASLVQVNSTNSGTSPVSLTYTTPTSGHLLVVICGTDAAATITGPSGFSTAINESGDPAQGIFYKVSAGSEGSVSCSFSTGGQHAIQIYEYSGTEDVSPLDIAVSTGSTGSTSPASSGSVTTRNTNDLLLAAVMSDASSGIGSWSNSFIQETSTTSGGKPSTRLDTASADLSVSSTGTYSTAPAVSSGSNWRGQIVSFKIAPASTFSGDIVNSGTGASISSPSVLMTSVARGFGCQTATGTLPASGESIRLTNTNPSDSNGWTLTIAASSSNWSDAGSDTYSYNNSSGSPPGCSAGQLTVDPSSETITPESAPEYGCTSTGITKGSSTAFSGVTPITIASAGGTASHYCYWDFTGVNLSQKIPATQPSGSYSIGLTLTYAAL
jgi:hypothetical protein